VSGLAQSLLTFQADAPKLHKDARNDHFRNEYVSLDSLMATVLPKLNAAGLVVLQLPTTLDGQPALRTRLIHAESGEAIEDVMLLNAAKPDPQGQGSALTYARRYALAATLGLVADEDDDGNAGSAGAPRSSGADGSRTGEAPAERSTFVPPDSVTNREQPNDGGSPEAVVVDFGKHKGKTLSQVQDEDSGYLRWLTDTFEPRSPSARRIQAAAAELLGQPIPAATGGGAIPDDDIPF